jgi:23S rRNA pseudouridine1911/1915/1917 synthase
MAPTQSRLVPAALEGPVDRAVRGLFGTSWGKARGWIEAGKVRVGGALVTEPTTRVVAGAEIAVDEAARKPHAQELADGDVVYADTQVVVVAKPPGLSTIPYDGTESDTLEARVRAWLERKRLVPRGQRPTLGIVHRLDKETSGLVVFTRTWLAKEALSSQFRHHTVHRLYLAIANGDVPARTLRSFFVENRGDGLRGSRRGTGGKARSLVRGEPGSPRAPGGGREAITHVARIEPLVGATFVACRLETGRTHQIRIHLSESGNPLVGERVYVRGFHGPLLEAPRLMLHATELGFVHPATEREMRWEQPLPEDMRSVLERLKPGPTG